MVLRLATLKLKWHSMTPSVMRTSGKDGGEEMMKAMIQDVFG